jgi:hypothetical protein
MNTGRIGRVVAGSIAMALALGLSPVAARARGDTAGPPRRDEAWTPHVRGAEDALARRDAGAAERAWHEAYIAAMGSWRWEGAIEVADLYLRIGEATGLSQAATARARNLYLIALFRARQQGSIDGLLRAAEGFARVAERDVADQCLRLAERLAWERGDPGAAARVRALATRLADALPQAGPVGP